MRLLLFGILLLMGSVSSRRERTRVMDRTLLFGAITKSSWLPVKAPMTEGITSFIVNGNDAQRGNHPWLISLQVYSRRRWVHICGGAILSPSVVVTAAHCFTFWGTLRHRVAAGWHILQEGSNQDQQNRIVRNIARHADYNKANKPGPNDIGLLFLEDPLDLTGFYVTEARLARPGETFIGQRCVIAGWGRTRGSNTRLPKTLQSVEVPVITLELCRRYWLINNRSNLANSNLCTHAAGNGTDALKNVCNGDSGGPLVCGDTVAGLVSWGRTGCVGCSPDVYTRIAFFYRWIMENQ
ncbi:fibrinolytic enzyme, isozyme C [Aplysia californica]|uniref:Fibrinolytic enzyme, isozyme C n=1 Tax=Aplysia californica TaxID=6500 RepID=A0ABM1A7M0_APLCA|nr:fibrinolytic enzyme, isozyme C [Aplysia californica]